MGINIKIDGIVRSFCCKKDTLQNGRNIKLDKRIIKIIMWFVNEKEGIKNYCKESNIARVQ